MAEHQPIEEHAQRSEVLFHRALGKRPLQFFNVGCDVERLQSAAFARTEIARFGMRAHVG